MKKAVLEAIKRTKLEEKQTLELANPLVHNYSRPLRDLRIRNEDINHINHKIYHLLNRPYTFINAHISIKSQKNFLIKRVDHEKRTNIHIGQVSAIKCLEELNTQSYSFKPVFISKLGKKTKRSIYTPTQRDRIVQESIRVILECIYEPEFKAWDKHTDNYSSNFGFRTGMRCWDALHNIKTKSRGTTWVIEGDFDKAYNSVDHKILLSVVKRRIQDKKFLFLLKSLLTSGIMDENRYEETVMGVPQGGILSPILFNIYMLEFDKWIYETFIKDKIKNKKQNIKKFSTKYVSFTRQLETASRALQMCAEIQDRKRLIERIRYLRIVRDTFLSREFSISTKCASYTRYADDWVLCLTGSKEDAQSVKEQIEEHCITNLKMTLSREKTLITNLSNGVNFLGFNFMMRNSSENRFQRSYFGGDSRTLIKTGSRSIIIGIDSLRTQKRLINERYAKLKEGKLFPIHNPLLTKLNSFEIVLHYRQLQIGIADYYRNCNTTKQLELVSYILQYSCAMTIANRERVSLKAVFKKYGNTLKMQEAKHGSNTSMEFPTTNMIRKESREKLGEKKYD